MDIRKTGINTRNLVDSPRSKIIGEPCECGIEPPGFISHGVIVS